MAFPGFWQLIIPNMNTATGFGIVVLILAALLLYLGFKFPAINTAIPLVKVIPTMILIGIVLIWGVSMFQDFVNTLEGLLIFWGVVITAVIAFLLFGLPKLGK